HPLPHRLRVELVRLRLGADEVGVHALVDQPRDLDVAAEGDGAEAVLRLAHLLAPDHRREADGEGVDAHPEQPGEEEVPELVDEDEDAQGEGDPEEVREDVEDGVHAGGVRGKAERTGKLRAAVPGGQTFHRVEGAGREEGMEGNASLYPPSPPLPPPSPSPTPRPA